MFLELDIIYVLQDWFSNPALKQFIIFCARWMIFVLGLGALATWRFGLIQRHAMVEVMWSTLLSALLAFGGGAALERARPFTTDLSLDVWIPRPHTFSFPSAHTSIAYGIALALLGWNVRVGIIAVILADLVAFGRITAGAHYPTDILAGLFVGALSFTLVRLGHRWVKSVPRSQAK